MPVLVIAEHDNLKLRSATASVVTAALLCGTEVDVLVMGHGCMPVAEAAATISGVSRVLYADGVSLAHGLAENAAEQVLAVAAGYSHILAPATAFGRSVLPRVAARMDVDQVSEVTRIISPDTFERPVYAGNAIATVQSSDAVLLVTVRPTAFAPAADGGFAPVVAVVAVPDSGKSAWIESQTDWTGRPELSSARVIVAGGHGVGTKEDFALIEKLADRLGAAIGASRAAVDAGFVGNDLQIGQTGKIVAPELYFAIGISGAIQHVAGIRDAGTIVAINLDPDAPIFLAADYGLVGDLHDVVPELTNLLDS